MVWDGDRLVIEIDEMSTPHAQKGPWDGDGDGPAR
jgi:hypothetical protein